MKLLIGALCALLGTISAAWAFFLVATQGPQAITSTSPSCGSSCVFTAGTASTVGTLSATMSPATPFFTGTWSIQTSGTVNGQACDSSGYFSTSGNSLNVNAVALAGTYLVCYVATQAGAAASPFANVVSVSTSTATFPLTISGGALKTSGGTPYLILADSPQASNSLPLCTAGNTYALCSGSTDTLPTNGTFVAYAKNRQAQGFNSLWINILCEWYTACNAGSGATQELTYPFTASLTGTGFAGGFNGAADTCSGGGTPADMDCWDMTSGINSTTGAATGANAAYWTHIDAYFKIAAQFGMQVIANPLPIDATQNHGSSSSSIGYMFLNNYQIKGAAAVTGFADFLYNRYGNPSSANYAPNLMWIVGNDYASWDSVAYPTKLVAGADAVFYTFTSRLHTDEAGGGHHLIILETDGATTPSIVDTTAVSGSGSSAWQNAMDLDGLYSGSGPMYDVALLGLAENTVVGVNLPGIVVEGSYQGENNNSNKYDGTATGTNITGCGQNNLDVPDSGGDPNKCPFAERVQFWQSVLGGSFAGYIDGNTYTWQFNGNGIGNWYNGTSLAHGTCTGTSGAGHSPCLDTVANANLSAAAAFLKSRIAWYSLVPDVTRGTADAGTGANISTPLVPSSATNYIATPRSQAAANPSGGQLQNRMPVSGRTSDGSTGIVYMQGISNSCAYSRANRVYTSCVAASGISVTVNNALINGGSNVTAAWYDPSGAMTSPSSTVCSPSTTVCNSGTQTYTTPGSCSGTPATCTGHTDTATNDWVLLLTSTPSTPSLTGITLANNTFTCGTAGAVGAVTVQGTGSIGAATLSLTGTDAAQFSLSSTTVPSNLTVGASPSGCPRSYNLNIVATLAGATGSPFTQAETVTGSSGGTQTVSSIAVAGTPPCTSSVCSTTGLASGSPIGTLSVSLSPLTPTFNYATATWTPSTTGSVCAGHGTGNSSFQILSDNTTLATNGTPARNTYDVCYSVSAPGIAAFQKQMTVSIGSLIQATAQSNCSGHAGTNADPWPDSCLKQAIALAGTTGPVDTVHLAAGNWALTTSDTSALVNNPLNVVGDGSGNTFDYAGHVSNPNGNPYTSFSGITRLFNNGTVYTSGAKAPGGSLTFGKASFNGGSTTCKNSSVQHLFSDGSGSYTGGDLQATISILECNPTLVNDIRALSAYQVGIVGGETMFNVSDGAQNITVQNSLFTNPACCNASGGAGYPASAAFQATNASFLNINNNSFYQYYFTPIYINNLTYTGNITFNGTDNVGASGNPDGEGIPGCAIGPGAPTSIQSCFSSNDPNGSLHATYANNYFNTVSSHGSNDVALGGFSNDPGTAGGIQDQNFTGNFVVGHLAAISACVFHYWNPTTGTYGGWCFPTDTGTPGMQVGGTVNSDCTESDTLYNGYKFTATNNTINGVAGATVDAAGTGILTVQTAGQLGGCWTTSTTNTNHTNTVVGFNASQNYLTSPADEYHFSAETHNPTVVGNFCAGTIHSFTQTDSTTCATTGFTTPPTASFTLNPLAGSTVLFNTATFTAQYGAVQWLASTNPTTPTSGGQSGTNCTAGGVAVQCSWSFVPPFSLAAAHGNTVYLWVMDSANHISAAASQVVP